MSNPYTIDDNGALLVKPDGGIASGAVDSGNAIKIGSVARSSIPSAVDAGDRVDLLVDTVGRVVVGIGGTASQQDAMSNSSMLGPTSIVGNLLGLGVAPALFNGTTWDRARNNIEGTLLASAARTATVSTTDQVNYNARGVAVTIDVTAITATPSVVFSIEAKDSLSGKYVELLASAAIVGTGTTRLVIYPGVTAAANLAASMPLPRIWRVTATHADADSITYSVGYSLTL